MESDKRKMFEKQIKVDNVYVPNEVEKRDVYNQYIFTQRPYFEDYMNYVHTVLRILKDFRIVSDFTQMSARIKSVASALKNDDSKALNDAFGIEVAFGSSPEKAFVQELLSSTITITKESVHNKSNGYVAHHYSGVPNSEPILVEQLEELLEAKHVNSYEMYKSYYNSLSEGVKEKFSKDDIVAKQVYFEALATDLKAFSDIIKEKVPAKYLKDLKHKLGLIENQYIKEIKKASYDSIPIIETQFKTASVLRKANIGTASHNTYKGITDEELQKQYEQGKLGIDEVPTMWVSHLDRSEIDCHIIPPTLLSPHQALKKTFPNLIIPVEVVDKLPVSQKGAR